MTTNNAINATFPFSPADGATGVANPTAHTIPIAEGSSNYNFIGPLTDGQFLGGVTAGDPKAYTASPGTNMASIIANAMAGTLTFNAKNSAISPYVVNPDGSTGYTTIQSALDAANIAGGGTIYLQPATYIEDLTLYDKTAVVGTTPLESLVNDAVSDVVLIGVHTPPSSGYFTFSDLLLQSGTDIFNSSAAGTTSLSILDCNVMLTSGYIFNIPNWVGSIYANNLGEASNDGGFINNSSGTASITAHDCHVGSFTGSNVMQLNNGTATFIRTEIRCPVTTKGGFNLYYCNSLNYLTFEDGSAALIYFSSLQKFGAPVININSSGGGGHIISSSTFNGFNNPIIGGTGTDPLLIQGVTFFGSSTITGSFSVIYKPWTVPFGGTGISTATANGVICGGTTSGGAFQVADPGTGGQVFTSNGAGSAPSFQDSSSLQWPKGYIYKMNLLYHTVGFDFVVTIQEGVCRDKDNSFNITNNSDIDLNINNSGAGGLDTGTVAASTWYYVHIIADSTGMNANNGIFSLSSSSPTLPAGYDKFRCVGTALTDSGAAVNFFRQYGFNADRTYWMLSNNNVLSSGHDDSPTVLNLSSICSPLAYQAKLRYLFTPNAVGNVFNINIGFITYAVTGLVSSQLQQGMIDVAADPSQQFTYYLSSFSDTLTLSGVSYTESLI